MTIGRRWNAYERFMLQFSHYEPEYSLIRIVKDGVLRGPRLLIWAQWALYAAAIETMLLAISIAGFGVYPPLLDLWLAAVLPLLAKKVWAVVWYAAPRPLWHRPDPLDWLCDVGAWGSLGALLICQLLGGYHVSWMAYAAIVALFAITYPWSSP